MKPADFENNVKTARTVFLSFASFIFLTALTFSFVTGNIFAEVALIIAGVVITAAVYYANKKFTV